jgi:transcriptional regulator with XRE-family HTH domain
MLDPDRPGREPAERPKPPSFGALLHQLRLGAGLSQNRLARLAEIDPAYVNRLEHGADQRPRRPTVLALARALACRPADADRLLVAAGHAPEAVARFGWEPLLGTLAEQLADPVLGPSLRLAIAGLVEHAGRARALVPASAPRPPKRPPLRLPVGAGLSAREGA